MSKITNVLLVSWVFVLACALTTQAQTVATWNPPSAGSTSGGFYSDLKEFNWLDPANWSWTVGGAGADPTNPAVPDNGIPDENTEVIIPAGTPVCWIPEDYTNYCIDKTTTPASPTVGNAPCAGNFEAVTRPTCKKITLNGGLYNQASLNNNNDTKSLYVKDVNGTSDGDFIIASGGVYLSEAFVTQVEGNFDLQAGGHLVVYNSDNSIQVSRDLTINGNITKQALITGRTLTFDFRGKESSIINGNHLTNRISTAQANVAPYMNFTHYYTYGAIDNLIISKIKNDPLNTAAADPTVSNHASFPILVGVMDNAGTGLTIGGSGNVTINGGALIVKNVTAGGFNLGASTFNGVDNWNWDIPASDINVRGKIFIANANVGTGTYTGSSLDLTGGSSDPRSICMHLGGNFEDLNIVEPSGSNGVRNGFYINGSRVSSRQDRRPTVVFNGVGDQDIRGINGVGTTFWLRDYNDNPTEGIGIAFPEVIINKAADKKVSINASSNLRIFGDLRLLSGIFDVNGRTFLFGDRSEANQYHGQTNANGDEINIYGTLNAPAGSVIKMNTGKQHRGTIMRVREGGLLKIMGTANNTNILIRDGRVGTYYRVGVYGGGKAAVVNTFIQQQAGRSNDFGLSGTNYATDASGSAGGNNSVGGFKTYFNASLLHFKENVLTGELELVDMNNPTFSNENPTTYDADYSSFSYCGFAGMGGSGAHLTINTGQKMRILNTGFGGNGGNTARNIVNNNTSGLVITVQNSSGQAGGVNGESKDGGSADDKVVWVSPTPVYWWGPPVARGYDQQWDTGSKGKSGSYGASGAGSATYISNDPYDSYYGSNPTLPNGSNTYLYHAALWSSADALGVSNVWSLNDLVWEPLPTGVVPGTAGNEDYTAYILARATRSCYVDGDYTLDGSIYVHHNGANNGVTRQSRRVLYFDNTTPHTMIVKGEIQNSSYSRDGRIYGGQATVQVGRDLFTQFAYFYPQTSHFIFNGTSSQEIRIGTNSFYNLTINKASGSARIQGIGGISGANKNTLVVRKDFVLQSGEVALVSSTPMLVMGDFIQTSGHFKFIKSPVNIQGNLNISGGTNDDGGTSTAALIFTPSDNTTRTIKTSGLKFSNIYFNKKIYKSGKVGHGSDTNPFGTTSNKDIKGEKAKNEPSDVVYQVTDDLESLNGIEIDENRILEVVGGKKIISADMIIRNKGQLITGTATQIQVKSGGKLHIQDGGFMQLMGSFSEYTKLTHDPSSSGTYKFDVDGTLKARYFLLEYMDKDGVNIDANAKILSPGTIVQGGGGENYSNSPDVTIAGGGGLGATASATVATSITKIDLADGGLGYLTNPTVTITGAATTPATATASIAGGVTGIYITNPGGGYSEMPTVAFTNGAGVSAVGKVTGSLDVLNITNAGSGYTTAPEVSLVDVSGATLVAGTATATITGSVTAISIDNAGAGYATFPTATIDNTATNGTGLAVTLKGSVTGITNLVGGSGYSSATATISAPGGGGTTATATVNISAGSLTEMTVTAGGTSYLSSGNGTFEVLISGGSGTGATATASVLNGEIYEIEITNEGTGYASADVLTLDFATNGGGGSGATATYTIISAGSITGLTFTNSGSGYTSIPTITLSGDGSGASADATLSITEVDITSGGSGYNSTPTIALDDPTTIEGVTTELTPVISGTVTALTIGSEGSGYEKAPLVYIASPAANADATVAGGTITGVTITSGGSGYTSAPSVTFVDPNGTGTGATGTATIVNGVVTAINITSTGNNTYSDLTRVIIGTPAGLTNAIGEAKLKVTRGIMSNPGTNYTGGFDLIFTGGTPTVAATAKATLSVTSISLTNPGDGYTAAPTITLGAPDAPVSFPGGVGDAVTATASAATIGSISSFTVTNNGTGYTNTPFVIIKDATGRGAEGQAILGATTIDRVLVLDGGKNYTATPTVTITGGGGTGATATAAISSGEVTNVVINNGGSGYGAPPTITFTGGGGTGATAEAVVIGGKVVSIGMVNYGSGYTSAPTITISGGGGTGATATAEIGGRVISVTLTNPGSGYTGTPAVEFSGGGATAISAIAAAYLTPTTLVDIVPTTSKVYPVATFSDAIFTNATEDGSTFITFPQEYSVYRNGSNDYSTTDALPANVTHDYSTSPAVDTIYNAVFPSNPDPILTFTNAPSNVKRTGTSNDPRNRVVFKDAIGTFSGEDFDSENTIADNNDNSLGINPFGIKTDSMILWREPNVVRWDGGLTGAGTAWNDPTNWRPDRVPGPGDFVIIDHRLLFLQWNLLKGPPDVISPSNFVVDMNLSSNTNPITCRSLTIETLLPEPNDGSQRNPITIEVNQPLTVLENLTISKDATVKVMNNTATISVGGSWSNEGTFEHGNGTVKFNQPFTRVIKAITSSVSFDPNTQIGIPAANLNAFYNLEIEDGTTDLNSYIRVENDLTIKNTNTKLRSSNNPIELWGNWQNEGTFSPDNGTVYFGSNLTQTIGTGYRTEATATAALTGDAVSSTFTITNPGDKYAQTPIVMIEGGGGTGATATATINGDGQLTGITLDTPGSGYTSAPTVRLVAPETEKFFNMTVSKIVNNVVTKNRIEIQDAGALSLREQKVISSENAEVILGLNATWTRVNGYVDGPVGSVYNSASSLTSKSYPVGKGDVYPGDNNGVRLDIQLTATPDAPTSSVMYIVEQFESAAVDGRTFPPDPSDNINYLSRSRHWKVRQARYPNINSAFPTVLGAEVNFSKAVIGLPFSGANERADDQIAALLAANPGLPLGTMVNDLLLSQLDELRILKDPGLTGPANATNNAKGLLAETPTLDTNGERWSNIGGGVNDITNFSIGAATLVSNEFTSLGTGTFTLGWNYTALPINLLSFEAKLIKNNQVKLDWVAQNEEEVKQYNVERSTDGVNFKTIGTIKASESEQSTQKYEMIDPSPEIGLNYYRIRQVQAHESSRRSRMVEVKVAVARKMEVYPNPATKTEDLQVLVPADAGDKVAVSILDIQGTQMYNKVYADFAGAPVTFPHLQLPKGIYIIKVTINDGAGGVKEQRIVIQ
ncbi:T9SS type A sorting domain-containing protein [Microscilla marina]|uniref:T9SS type A sorting domain-containing protein n=1 Tax=Microscilla marina TaxID=1027 RepID=UPI0005D47230|nr:T9SS type A sorting domain-containing protein [Microscilla marina]